MPLTQPSYRHPDVFRSSAVYGLGEKLKYFNMSGCDIDDRTADGVISQRQRG